MNFAGMLAANGVYGKEASRSMPADVRFNVNIHGGEIQASVVSVIAVFGLAGMVSLVNGEIVALKRLKALVVLATSRSVVNLFRAKQWWVNIVGKAVELNQELYQALSTNQKSIWEQICAAWDLGSLAGARAKFGVGRSSVGRCVSTTFYST
jgi:hypothetical protein